MTTFITKITSRDLETYAFTLNASTPNDAFREGVHRFKNFGFTRKDISYVEVIKVMTDEVVLRVVA